MGQAATTPAKAPIAAKTRVKTAIHSMLRLVARSFSRHHSSACARLGFGTPSLWSGTSAFCPTPTQNHLLPKSYNVLPQCQTRYILPLHSSSILLLPAPD